MGGGGQLIWNTSHPNSVYNNTAPVGMDFLIDNCEDIIEINILLGSRALTAPDRFFVLFDGNTQMPIVNIAQSYFPLIDSDVFVSPNGDDTNSGLSVSSPFKTIRHALQVISSNPNNPRTVHLSAGIFSMTANEQVLPLSFKPHVKIVGAGVGQTILDGNLQNTFFAGWDMHGVYLSDVTFINSRAEQTKPIELVDCSDIELRNLSFSNNCGYGVSGVYLLRSNDIILENLNIGNTTIDEDLMTISAIECNELFINGVLSHNNHMTFSNEYFVGFYFSESDVVLRNSILTNNIAPDAHVLQYQNVDPVNSANNLDMSNVLVVNNSIAQNMQSFAPVYLQNRFQTMKIYNCTFANNTGGGLFSRIFGYADIRNHISYNPGQNGEMFLHNHVWSDIEWIYYDTEVSISNSLFRSSSVVSNLPNLVTFTDNIFNGNPLFLGATTDTLDVSLPEYYYLSENSPCINTGIADTTGMNLTPMDLAGNQRVWDNRIDMGCYEYGSEPYVPNDNPENPPLPDKIALSIYPNPVCLSSSRGAYTFIEFTLPEQPKEQPVIEIYNIKGQKIKTIRLNQSYNGLVSKAGLSKQVKQNGEFYSTIWNCRNEYNQPIGSGLYIIKVTSGNQQAVSKMMVIK